MASEKGSEQASAPRPVVTPLHEGAISKGLGLDATDLEQMAKVEPTPRELARYMMRKKGLGANEALDAVEALTGISMRRADLDLDLRTVPAPESRYVVEGQAAWPLPQGTHAPMMVGGLGAEYPLYTTYPTIGGDPVSVPGVVARGPEKFEEFEGAYKSVRGEYGRMLDAEADAAAEEAAKSGPEITQERAQQLLLQLMTEGEVSDATPQELRALKLLSPAMPQLETLLKVPAYGFEESPAPEMATPLLSSMSTLPQADLAQDALIAYNHPEGAEWNIASAPRSDDPMDDRGAAGELGAFALRGFGGAWGTGAGLTQAALEATGVIAQETGAMPAMLDLFGMEEANKKASAAIKSYIDDFGERALKAEEQYRELAPDSLPGFLDRLYEEPGEIISGLAMLAEHTLQIREYENEAEAWKRGLLPYVSEVFDTRRKMTLGLSKDMVAALTAMATNDPRGPGHSMWNSFKATPITTSMLVLSAIKAGQASKARLAGAGDAVPRSMRPSVRAYDQRMAELASRLEPLAKLGRDILRDARASRAGRLVAESYPAKVAMKAPKRVRDARNKLLGALDDMAKLAPDLESAAFMAGVMKSKRAGDAVESAWQRAAAQVQGTARTNNMITGQDFLLDQPLAAPNPTPLPIPNLVPGQTYLYGLLPRQLPRGLHEHLRSKRPVAPGSATGTFDIPALLAYEAGAAPVKVYGRYPSTASGQASLVQYLDEGVSGKPIRGVDWDAHRAAKLEYERMILDPRSTPDQLGAAKLRTQALGHEDAAAVMRAMRDHGQRHLAPGVEGRVGQLRLSPDIKAVLDGIAHYQGLGHKVVYQEFARAIHPRSPEMFASKALRREVAKDLSKIAIEEARSATNPMVLNIGAKQVRIDGSLGKAKLGRVRRGLEQQYYSFITDEVASRMQPDPGSGAMAALPHHFKLKIGQRNVNIYDDVMRKLFEVHQPGVPPWWRPRGGRRSRLGPEFAREVYADVLRNVGKRQAVRAQQLKVVRLFEDEALRFMRKKDQSSPGYPAVGRPSPRHMQAIGDERLFALENSHWGAANEAQLVYRRFWEYGDIPAVIRANPKELVSQLSKIHEARLSRAPNARARAAADRQHAQLLGRISNRNLVNMSDEARAYLRQGEQWLREEGPVGRLREVDVRWDVMSDLWIPKTTDVAFKLNLAADSALRSSNLIHRLNRWVKGKLTVGTSAVTAMNFMSNMFLQIMRRGDVAQPVRLAQVAREWRDFKAGKITKSSNPEKYAFYEALEHTGFQATDFVKSELAGGFFGDKFSTIGDLIDKITLARPQERIYRAVDHVFKVEEAARNFPIIRGWVDRLEPGRWMDLKIHGNQPVRLSRTEGGQYLINEMPKRTFNAGKVVMVDEARGVRLTGSPHRRGARKALDGDDPLILDLIAEASMQPSIDLFFSLGDEVGSIAKWVQGNRLVGLASPFYGWFAKSMDILGFKPGLLRQSMTGMPYLRTSSPALTSEVAAKEAAMATRRAAVSAGLTSQIREHLTHDEAAAQLYDHRRGGATLVYDSANPNVGIQQNWTSANYMSGFQVITSALASLSVALLLDKDSAAKEWVRMQKDPKLRAQYLNENVLDDTDRMGANEAQLGLVSMYENGNLDEGLGEALNSAEVSALKETRRLIAKYGAGEHMGWDVALGLVGMGGGPLSNWIVAAKDSAKRGEDFAPIAWRLMSSAMVGGTVARTLKALDRTVGLGDGAPTIYDMRKAGMPAHRLASSAVTEAELDMFRELLHAATGMTGVMINHPHQWAKYRSRYLRNALKASDEWGNLARDLKLTGREEEAANAAERARVFRMLALEDVARLDRLHATRQELRVKKARRPKGAK